MKSNINKILFTIIRICLGIALVLLVISVATRLSKTAYDYGYRVFTESAIDEAPGKDVLFKVDENMTQKEIASSLEEKGLVREAQLFYVQLKLSAYNNKIIPGEYVLNTSMTPKEMIVLMATSVESTESTEAVESTEGTVPTKEDTTEKSSEE